MLTPTTQIAALALSMFLVGCSSARKVDVLEARLRSQEDMIAGYKSEMNRVKSELSVARREAEDLRLRMAGENRPVPPAEVSQALARTSGIEFSTLMTGGWDIDGQPGHDGLSVVLIPHDQDGELVKIPGTIEIEAFDLSQPGGAQRIGRWSFDQRDIHEYWHAGVIQSGYQFELPWQTPPQSDQVLVHGHLKTANGRTFDTTLTVKVDASGSRTAAASSAVQQVAAEDLNPFDGRRSANDFGTTQTGDDGVIWADGEGPAPQNSRLQPSPQPFRTDAGRISDGSAEPGRRGPRPLPLAADRSPRRNGAPTKDRTSEVPPPIEDWWSDDDWATIDTDGRLDGTQTSDSFTDETLRRYR